MMPDISATVLNKIWEFKIVITQQSLPLLLVLVLGIAALKNTYFCTYFK